MVAENGSLHMAPTVFIIYLNMHFDSLVSLSLSPSFNAVHFVLAAFVLCCFAVNFPFR